MGADRDLFGDTAATFTAPISYDLSAKNGLASVSFLDSEGSTGAGWTDGYTSGVQLPGTLSLKADQSGTLNAALGVYGGTMPPIHVTASWTCPPA